MKYGRGSRLTAKIKSGLINSKDGAEGENSGGGGGTEEKWYTTLPEDMQSWEEVNKADSPEKFYDYLRESRKHLGASIRIPGEDAGQEAWDAFNEKILKKVPSLMTRPNTEDEASMDQIYNSLGRPEKPEEYAVPEMENLDTNAAEAFKPLAHKHGLSNKQYEGVVKDFTNLQLQQIQSNQESIKAQHIELQKEWGGDYERRVELAYNLAKLTDAPTALQEMFKNKTANAESYKWMVNLATRFKGEGSNLLNDINDKPPAMTPNEAQIKIDEIRGNKKHPYWIKEDPGHKAAVKKMGELYNLRESGK